jgi:preprotein translocase subunit SecG|tara:strand:- start:144 stop:485 length:342 start_codon:yes stop_codon:yes gene_type:complete
MESVILVIHLIVALAIILLVLLQRSEGGGLGIGGGSGGLGNLATAHGTANMLTRATAIAAACFFITSLALGILASKGDGTQSVLDALDAPIAGIAVEKEVTEDMTNPQVPISE